MSTTKYTAYLGDSVYLERNMVTNTVNIHTNNGGGPENIIWLEPATAIALLRRLKEIYDTTTTSNHSHTQCG